MISSEEERRKLRFGQSVLVSGTVCPGSILPIIADATFTIEKHQPDLQPPYKIAGADFENLRNLDARWAEFKGVVVDHYVNGDQPGLLVALDQRLIKVLLPTEPASSENLGKLGNFLKVRGQVMMIKDAKPGHPQIEVLTQTKSQIVRLPVDEAPLASLMKRIDQAKRFTSTDGNGVVRNRRSTDTSCWKAHALC